MRKTWLVVLLTFSIEASFAWHVAAQPAVPAAKPPAPAAGEQSAEVVLKQMTDFLGRQQAYSTKLESTLEFTAKDPHTGQPAEKKTTTTASLRLARPNKLALVIDQGVSGLTVVSDGKQMTQFLPIVGRYVVSEAPAHYGELFDMGAPMPITMLGCSDDTIPTGGEDYFKSLMEGVSKSEFVGREKVGDVLCNRLRFTQEDFDWDIWIEAGARPVIHKMQPDLSKQIANSGGQIEKASYTVKFSDWNLSPKFTDADFKFTPPPKAQQADSLFESPEEPPHALLGQPAPAFTTTDVNGKPVDLQKHIGKSVILLDFWATWCGPCVQAMPQVEEVAKKFKEKGLVFYAVNVGEDADTIKKFLAEAKLDPPVAMNVDNKISELYRVEGIPQTLLIGKDGTVQVVHVGYSPALGKMLTKEIEALLAGKDLAKEALAKAAEAQKKQDAEPASPPPPEQAK